MLGCSSKSYSFVFFGSIVLLVQAFFGNDGIGGGGDIEAGRSSPGGVGVGSGLRQLWGLKNRGASNTEGAAHIQTVDVIFEKNMLLRKDVPSWMKRVLTMIQMKEWNGEKYKKVKSSAQVNISRWTRALV